MPLITCPDCKKEVSDRAPSCPHCGAPIASQSPATPPAPAEVVITDTMLTRNRGCGDLVLYGFFGAIILALLILLGWLFSH